MASVSGGYPAWAGERTREKEGNAKAQSRREEHEKDSVVAVVLATDMPAFSRRPV